MLKTVILLFLCIATSYSTRFLFGVKVKCNLDEVFQFTVSHFEDDQQSCWICFFNNDDSITSKKTLTAWKSLFFYQDGIENGDGTPGSYEPYAHFEHNCSTDGEVLSYRHNLWSTPTSHGLEYLEYSVDLLDKSGTGEEL